MVINAQSQFQANRLDTIRFSPGVGSSLDHLIMGSESDLLAAKRQSAPVAHVIHIPDVDNLKALPNCIVDCGMQKRSGKKRQTIQLHKYLLKKREKIPLIRAVYDKPGRAEEGIKKLLERARVKGDQNLYLIAVQTNIYKGLLQLMSGRREPNPGQAIFMEQIKDDPEIAKKYMGRSPEYLNVRKNIIVAADSDIPVLIIGESGTGKEVVARAIHSRSHRNETGRFVAVNSAAIPGELLEEELFGIEPGVIPDVKRLKKGLWEVANGGTIFLDEIGDMSLEHQGKVLRALQDGTIRRVGGTEDIIVDARVIAATNRDLRDLMVRREFREDLFYRLDVFNIYTPALRTAPEEIEYIAQENWRLVTGGSKPPLSKEIIKLLSDYALAGNVRTVKNALRKLNAYMNAEKLARIGKKYFEAAMRTPDHLRPAAAPKASARDIRAYRSECVDKLRQASKAVRRCKVDLRPFPHGGSQGGDSIRRMQSKLRQPHKKLDELCLDPSAFYSHETFRDVSRFSGKLSNFRKLLDQDPTQAVAYWDAELHAQYDLALARIQDGIKGLVKGE
ncbi:MAG: sigma 54-interacting transcriptional regulator [Acidobacteria bacterium]|nr:sigma 54-interacting transcriptional regulator [Acidobacteriota bacterium]